MFRAQARGGVLIVIAAVEQWIVVAFPTVVRSTQRQRENIGPVGSARTGAKRCAAGMFYRIFLSTAWNRPRAHVCGAKLATTAWVRMLAGVGCAPIADLQIPAGNLDRASRGLHGNGR